MECVWPRINYTVRECVIIDIVRIVGKDIYWLSYKLGGSFLGVCMRNLVGRRLFLRSLSRCWHRSWGCSIGRRYVWVIVSKIRIFLIAPTTNAHIFVQNTLYSNFRWSSAPVANFIVSNVKTSTMLQFLVVMSNVGYN